MKERVDEFVLQARVFATTEHHGMNFNIDVFHKKFAELIIRECAKFLDENSGYDNANNAWHPEPEDLLKHFGVK